MSSTRQRPPHSSAFWADALRTQLLPLLDVVSQLLLRLRILNWREDSPVVRTKNREGSRAFLPGFYRRVPEACVLRAVLCSRTLREGVLLCTMSPRHPLARSSGPRKRDVFAWKDLLFPQLFKDSQNAGLAPARPPEWPPRAQRVSRSLCVPTPRALPHPQPQSLLVRGGWAQRAGSTTQTHLLFI